MHKIFFTERIIGLNDWATILFLVAFVAIAINRNIFGGRFSEFLRLAVSDKYTKIYKESSNIRSGFTVSLFFVQMISFSFFILLLLAQFYAKEKYNAILYIQIFTFLTVFILCKYLIEKIIATSFKIEEFAEQFNLLKVTYRTYIGLLLLPINIILFYNAVNSNAVYIILILLITAFSSITYLITLKTYQSLVSRKIFYFILYLCTFEIAPYYFMYYWITKN
ncbi:DUF4271 domain-containing protein [Flavobacterium sp. NRK F10]|uniref:DUF4271 domain-containing protein n=1 Tax=Flavobacterium sp. NRK F10 TaxID=2954931 RepID=UPI00209177D0|nr:DUF4271 domain-containing protein [Flavobacterium sp. NRK F10]MCO6175006.1 DUF4271 domain-containing protein [Flavobacterium sp. NRK F10]